MKVDISKYKSFEKTTKYLLPLRKVKVIDEPYLAKSLTSYNFKYNEIFFITKKDLEQPRSANPIIEFQGYEKIKKSYLISLSNSYLYINEGNFEIPYEYYSKAYVEYFDLDNTLEASPKIITFELDSLGRLHIKKECLGNWLFCMEKKFPKIRCNIVNQQIERLTLENQTSLAKKYLTPNILIEEIPGSSLEQYTKKDSILYKLLENANLDMLEFCLPQFLKLKDFENYKDSIVSGFIFKDGSYLIMNGDMIYHYFICKFIFKEEEIWMDNNCIRIDSKFAQGKTIASYLKTFITPEAKNTLEKFKRKFYIEEQAL